MAIDAHLAYCAGCDRKVRVIVNPRVAEERREPGPQDLICLEHGVQCTGDLCPLFDVPSQEMKERYKDLIERARERLGGE
ncbi:MAG: hypothetical protein KJO11_13850 [Gemmatimonadetes bacterium]|nr:hypothetical protein [Gemmatimonadota bacterium]MBT8404821.1 hypothetical protein [Gemmatimonadota bacterium]NNF38260.1 hypothetical protein [Gemmatimonadota bacterium]NNK64882.1 hypothetical protein [Gemmatimonadota bacterium]